MLETLAAIALVIGLGGTVNAATEADLVECQEDVSFLAAPEKRGFNLFTSEDIECEDVSYLAAPDEEVTTLGDLINKKK